MECFAVSLCLSYILLYSLASSSQTVCAMFSIASAAVLALIAFRTIWNDAQRPLLRELTKQLNVWIIAGVTIANFLVDTFLPYDSYSPMFGGFIVIYFIAVICFDAIP